MWPALLLCAFLSGFAALSYELLWTRLFTHVFGHTTLAISTVLAAFMAGLAAGSYLGGAAAKRFPGKLLMLYAAAELGIGVFGLLSKAGIEGLEALFLAAGLAGGGLGWQTPLWFAGFFAVLALPTALMGATLPLLVMAYRREDSTAGSLASVYAWNTAGGVLGVLATGYWMIIAIGVSRSLIVAAGLNLVAAAVSGGCFRREVRPAGEVRPAPSRKAERKPEPQILILVFLSGFAALLYEVAWTRPFTFVLGSSTYAFTLILAVFLSGLALGSLLFKVLRKRMRITSFGLAAVQWGIAASVLAGLLFFERLPFLYVGLLDSAGSSFVMDQAAGASLCALIMAVPTMLMGISLPWAMRLIEGGDGGAVRLGKLYSSNTLGCILGSVLAGFVLIPMLGPERTLAAGIAASVAASLAALHAARPLPLRRSLAAGAVCAIIALGTLTAPGWNKIVMDSGPFSHLSTRGGLSKFRKKLDQRLRTGRMLFYEHGISATVAVMEDESGRRYLRINGKTEASSSRDMNTQLVLGYLPLLLHPSPRKALVIGLGAGVTLGALAQHRKMESLDCVEIEPAVAAAARYFDQINHGALDDPRTRIFFTDARHFLAESRERYDLIVSEPSNPWMAGVSSLYTQEAFALARERLAPHGIFSQWFHSYQMTEESFKMVMATFRSVFPHTLLYETSFTNYLLLGSLEPWRTDYEKLGERIGRHPGVAGDLERLALDHPFALLAAGYIVGDRDWEKYARGAPLNTDDRPLLEFSAQRARGSREEIEISRNLHLAKSRQLPEGLRGYPSDYFKDPEFFAVVGQAAFAMRHMPKALFVLQHAAELDPGNAAVLDTMGRIYATLGRNGEAEEHFLKATRADPSYSAAYLNLAKLYDLLGEGERSEQWRRKGLQLMEKRGRD